MYCAMNLGGYGFWVKIWIVIALGIGLGLTGTMHGVISASTTWQETGTPAPTSTPPSLDDAVEPLFSVEFDSRLREAAWTADGQRIIAWDENEIRVLDGLTGELLASLTAGGQFSRVMWTPNGTVILGMTRTGSRLVWDVRDVTQPYRRLEQFGGQFVTWGGNGSILVTTNVDETQLRIWNCYTGMLVGEIPIGRGAVKVSPNAQYLLMWGNGLELVDIFAEDGPQRRVLVDQDRMDENADWAWSPDSTRFAVMTSRGFRIEIMTIAGLVQQSITFLGPSGGPRLGTMYWSETDSYIYATIGRGRLEVWNADTGEAVLTIGSVLEPSQIEWGQIGADVYLAYRFVRSVPSTLEVWNVMQGVQVYVIEGMEIEGDDQLTSVSADMEFVTVTAADGDWAEIWYGATQEMVVELGVPSQSLRLPFAFEDGALFLGWNPTAYYYGAITENRLLVWDLRALNDFTPPVNDDNGDG